MNTETLINLLASETVTTLYLTLVSTVAAYALGLPLGIILVLTDKDGIHPNKAINVSLGIIINILRSVPFLILMVWMMPFTRHLVGTATGNRGLIIEAAQSMGAPTGKIITKVMLGEARPSLLIGFAITITTILGYTAMAGFCGGGGLGKIAVNYGLYKYQSEIMNLSVILLVIIVQIFQEAGTRLARKLDKRL